MRCPFCRWEESCPEINEVFSMHIQRNLTLYIISVLTQVEVKSTKKLCYS
jgi:hypothetical protein